MPKHDKSTIYLGVEFGLLIALPMVGFLLLGLLIDMKANTFPIYLIAGVFLGVLGAFLIIYKGIIPYLNKKVNNKHNNK